MKIDTHVHSRLSKRPSQWILKKIGCPESFTEPLRLYQIAKSRGMSHVTITDHNAIEGALEIAHLPDTFISEEITTYFPDNRCKIHVLALNINESHHLDIQKVRENIFDLAAYLHREDILSIVAHPLYAINDRLTVAHFEKLLLLFKNFELNGARNIRENQCLREVLGNLTPKTIALIADKHNLSPMVDEPWKKNLWGGSDDHSALNIARTHTEISGIADPRNFSGNTGHVKTEVISKPSTPLSLGHNLYSIAYQYYQIKFNLDRYAAKDSLIRFLDQNLRVEEAAQPGLLTRLYLLWRYRKKDPVADQMSDSLVELLRHETSRLIHEDPGCLNTGGCCR